MGRVDALIRSRLSSEVALINEISGYIINAGGKRLRPATVLLAGRALGAQGDLTCLLAVWMNSITTASRQAISVSAPRARPASSTVAGRRRLPPALMM